MTPEEINARRRENYANNKDKFKQYYITWYHNNIEKRLLTNAKARAKQNNLDFDLTLEDIKLPDVCPYLKTKLTSGKSKSFDRSTTYSLDRIDSSKGYTKDNVEVISHLANGMKQDATKEQLIEFAKSVLVRNGYFVGKSSDPRH